MAWIKVQLWDDGTSAQPIREFDVPGQWEDGEVTFSPPLAVCLTRVKVTVLVPQPPALREPPAPSPLPPPPEQLTHLRCCDHCGSQTKTINVGGAAGGDYGGVDLCAACLARAALTLATA